MSGLRNAAVEESPDNILVRNVSLRNTAGNLPIKYGIEPQRQIDAICVGRRHTKYKYTLISVPPPPPAFFGRTASTSSSGAPYIVSRRES